MNYDNEALRNELRNALLDAAKNPHMQFSVYVDPEDGKPATLEDAAGGNSFYQNYVFVARYCFQNYDAAESAELVEDIEEDPNFAWAEQIDAAVEEFEAELARREREAEDAKAYEEAVSAQYDALFASYADDAE